MKNDIKKIMSGCYVPTKSDVIRIYDEFSKSNEKSELSSILSDVFDWLSQEPQSISYKNGVIYVRPELNTEDIFVYHVIFIDERKNLYIDEKLSNDNIFEMTIKDYLPSIKEFIAEMIVEEL